MTCICGIEITAEDLETLIDPVHRHITATHPEYAVSTVSVRNYLEAEERSTGRVEPLAEFGTIRTEPITPDQADNIIDFFDHAAFPDNPAWGSCYCMFFFWGGRANAEWGHRPWREVRSAQHERIVTGRTTGALAYAGDRLVGWCNATARSEMPDKLKGGDDAVSSVVCFVVAPPYRGHGVAKALLDEAVEMARGAGFSSVEGYPVADPADQRVAFHGSLGMFQGAGFYVAGEDPLVVRLDL
jgi:GNAT superfamily N-acetyltransferase